MEKLLCQIQHLAGSTEPSLPKLSETISEDVFHSILEVYDFWEDVNKQQVQVRKFWTS